MRLVHGIKLRDWQLLGLLEAVHPLITARCVHLVRAVNILCLSVYLKFIQCYIFFQKDTGSLRSFSCLSRTIETRWNVILTIKKQDKNTLGFTAWSSVTSTASAWHQLYPGRQLYSNPSFVTLFLSSGLTEHANTVSLHHALTADWSPDSSSTWCHHCLPRPGRVANYPYRFAFTALAKSRLDFVTYWKVPAQREKSKAIQIFKEF